MAKNYVLANHDFGTNSVVYYQGAYYKGGDSYGRVDQAVRFDYDEILDFLKKHHEFLGFSVIRIEDCTFDLFKTNEELVKKYSKLEYAIR